MALSDATRALHVLIPAQGFTQAKSRLAPMLAPGEREALSRWMLHNMLRVLGGAAERIVTHVLSHDDEVHRLATASGARAAHDRPRLRGHGDQLRAFADALPEADALLVLMSDLPLFDAAAFEALSLACADADVLLAPDRHALGTNAAYFADGSVRRLCFGHEDSFERHLSAVPPRARVRVFRAPAFEFDLDVPEDLAAIRAQLRARGYGLSSAPDCLAEGSHA